MTGTSMHLTPTHDIYLHYADGLYSAFMYAYDRLSQLESTRASYLRCTKGEIFAPYFPLMIFRKIEPKSLYEGALKNSSNKKRVRGKTKRVSLVRAAVVMSQWSWRRNISAVFERRM